MNSGDSQKEPRRLPDPAICRGKFIIPKVVECLVEKPRRCPHALSFAGGYLCHSPEQMEIVARTEAEKNKPQ